MSESPLLKAVKERRTLLCVGAGGVGKTTLSASLALSGALQNRRSLVCTIDPARRLASALGLSQLGNAETPIPADRLSSAGLPSTLPLFAMMLDMKQTWDEFIERNAAPEDRERILGSRFYRSLSSVLAGSQEYIAMEKLWELRRERDYELLVLDTPPTAHALDFLSAPTRVLDFLGSDAVRLLLTPALSAGKFGLSFLTRGGTLTRGLSRFTGTALLQELAGFMLALSGLQERFRSRAEQVKELLADAGTAFVIVTGASSERLDEALSFHHHLRAQGHPVVAVVVNRVHTAPDSVDVAAQDLSSALRAKVKLTLEEAQALAARDGEGLARLRAAIAPTPIVQVPQFESDVHELIALERTARYLTES
jgi:anion-transporting  ArsA/GET3 family ATPase